MSYPSPPIPHIGSTTQCVAEPQVVQNCLMSLLTVQQELEAWSQRSRMEVDVMYAHLCESIHRLRGFVHSSDGKVHFGIGALNRVSGGVPVTPPRHANAPSNMSGMLERLNPPGTGSAPYPSGPSGAFLASGPMSTSATPQRVGGTTSMNHSVHTTPNRGGKLTNLPFPGTSYGSSSAGGPHSHVMSSTGSNAPHGASKLPSGSGAHGTHGENENLKQHDDDAWHDITANISRELGGTTVNHVDDTRKGGSATSVTASSSGAIGEGITPPSLDTPDVTPMASPPCLEKRPVANLFGGGSAPINFELLFQQLSQEDVHAALPRSGVSDTERDPWAGYDSRSAASSAGNTPSQLHPRRPLNMALGGTVTPPSAHTPTTATGDRLGHTPSSGLATVRPSISMDTVLQCSGQNVMKHLQVVYADHGRPTVMRVEGMDESVMPPPLDPSTPCQVLVEFKRRRVLQYDSPVYIIPGEYAIVAGDRGDDLGLVIFSWYNTPQGVTASGLSGASVGKWIGLGIGKVVRSANPVEVSQVHGIQSELERRAVEVCQQRAGEFQLPMTIVDAEYQFDRKKLTFYYEANQRLDFRELVRDLYRTFRARIWMEMVDATL